MLENPSISGEVVRKGKWRSSRWLTAEKVEEIRRVFEETQSYTETARRCGVVPTTVINRVGKGKTLGNQFPLEKIEGLRKVFEETKSYTETSRRTGVDITTLLKYIGKGKSKYRKKIASNEEIWRVAVGEAQGNLSKAARILGYTNMMTLWGRLRRMGRLEEFRRRYPITDGSGMKKGLDFERDIYPKLVESRGNMTMAAEGLGICVPGVKSWIHRRYPRGSTPQERLQEFRRDFPKHNMIRRSKWGGLIL